MSENSRKNKKSKHKNQEDNNSSLNTQKAMKKSSKKRKINSENEVEVDEKKSVKFAAETIDNEVEGNPKSKKKSQEVENYAPLSEELEAEIQRPENIKNVTSKRQQKREKYEKLKAENKLKNETQMQQRALNYLSLWRHNRQEWKFEKVKQIWLQTHIFDSSRIPDEFWDTTLQYFGGSKGRIRKFLIEECMKTVDNSEGNEEEKSEIEETKYKRARELLQHLQE